MAERRNDRMAMDCTGSTATGTARHLWAIDLDVNGQISLPSGEAVDRDGFFGWLWDIGGDLGLAGICEGSVGADEAVQLGLTDSARVLDAAAAPPDRDWVGGLATLTATCWFGDEPAARAAAMRLTAVRGCRVRGVRREQVPAAEDDWRRHYPPVVVPGFGVVRPAWDRAAADDGSTVFIEPGVGFGTGLHDTTRLCLAALAAWLGEGGVVDRVLDFGAGSGILGIAAAVSGARVVDAVEIDDRVHVAIRDNAGRNGVADRVAVHETLPAAAAYDLVFANIVAAVLLEHAEQLCGRVGRAGGAGCLVLSGLLGDECGRVAERYTHLLGVRPIEVTSGEWHCLRFVLGGPHC